MATQTITVTASGTTANARTPLEIHGMLTRISAKPVGSVNANATLAVRVAGTINAHTVLTATAANVAFNKYQADFVDRIIIPDGKFLEVVAASASNGNQWTVEIEYLAFG